MPIAIIGMACRVAGARSCGEFWTLLSRGGSAIRSIPRDRWNVEGLSSTDPNEPGRTVMRRAGFIDGIDLFDHRFFGMSSREAKSTDPQQRLLLETVWHCLEDAGLTATRLGRSTTGVFAGVMAIDYQQNLTAPGTPTDGYACLGTYAALLANRVSHSFGWNGPSCTVDAACASSLVALHQARRALLAGECDYAVVGAANAILNPWRSISFSQARMLSPGGLCRTFDRDADGYVPGEGVIVLLVRRLEDALRDGDRIHGHLLGSAVNHVGGSRTITAPSVASQSAVIRGAAAEAGVRLDSVSYVEAHGTGTALGDPIEIEALTRAFREDTDRIGFCRVGSVKTNIGHLEAAAGLAGVVKVLLMMRHGRIVPTLNLENPNPLIDFTTGPFVPARAEEPWSEAPLRAGVSSFGFGGANAHVILEAPRPARGKRPKASQAAAPTLFLLSTESAASLDSLRDAWRQLALSGELASLPFQDLCQTLMQGRPALGHRWGAVVDGAAELEKLLCAEPAEAAEHHHEPARIVLRFGQPDWLDDAVWAELLAALPLLESCWERGEAARQEGQVRSSPRLSAFLRQHALGEALLALGVAPDLLYGEGVGRWVSVALSGLLPLPDAVKASGGTAVDVAAPQRPHLPVYDPVLERTLGPCCLDERCLETLLGMLELESHWVEALLAGARELLAANRTFQGFFETWRSAVGPAIDLDGMMADPSAGSAAHRRVLVLALATSRARLCRRWSLSEPPPRLPAAWQEAAALVGDELLSPESAVRWLLDGRPPAEALEEPGAALSSERFPILASLSRSLDEIGDVEAWVRGRHGRPRKPAAKGFDLTIDIGQPSTSPPTARHVVVGPERPGRALLTALLELWKSGVPIDWTPLHQPFERLDVPAYPFDRSRHWIPLAEAATPEVAEPTARAVEGLLYARRWSPVVAGPSQNSDDALVIGEAGGLGLRLATQVGARHAKDVRAALEAIREHAPGEVYLLSPAEAAWSGWGLAEAEERLIDPALDLVRTLMALGEPVKLRIATSGLAAVRPGDRLDGQVAAPVVGLARAAARECPRLALSVVDIERPDTDPQLLLLEANSALGELAIRNGECFAASLRAVTPPAPAAPRDGRVWLIAGGHGGVGRAVAAHLMARERANVVLLGRRPAGEMEGALGALRAGGGEIFYLQADILDAQALRAAVTSTVDRLGPIAGVANAAMVLADRAVGGMDEEGFKTAFAPKARGTVNLYEAVRDQPLEAFVAFSSVLTIRGHAGQANYLAGCAFQEAYARHLAARGVPAKVIRWGYWGESGRVATPAYRERLAREGYLPLSDAEGVACFEAALASPEVELVAARLDPSHRAGLEEVPQPAGAPAESPASGATEGRIWADLDRWGVLRLGALLRERGVLPEGARGVGRLVEAVAPLPKYRRLVEATEAALARHGVLAGSGGSLGASALVAELDAVERRLGAHRPAYDGAIALVEACVPKWLDVARGEVPGTDVLFPEGRLDRVIGYYAGHPQADRCNRATGAAVRAIVDRLAAGAGPVRILEVGAGTGMTTEAVLAALDGAGADVEYVYTDISLGFVNQGRRRLGPGRPWMRFERVDLEAEPDTTAALGAFDIILAANAIHATSRLGRTLDHLVARLSPRGTLVLNELTRLHDYLTLTFGLLDGWWAAVDERAGHGPLLDIAGWRRALEALFHRIAVEGDEQSIITAEGPVAAVRPAPDRIEARAAPTVALPVEPISLRAARAPATGEARETIRRVVAETIGASPGEIADTRPFAELGVDSILSAELAARLGKALGRPLRAGLLNDHPTVAKLADYVGSAVSASPERAPTPMPVSPVPIRMPEAPAMQPPPGAARPATLEAVRAAIAGSLGIAPDSVPTDAPLDRLGVDSLLGIDVTERLRQSLGVKLAPGIVDEHRTVERLASHVQSRLGGLGRSERPATLPPPAEATPPRTTRRVVVRHPGILDSIELTSAPVPSPGPREVRVRVEAAGLNFRDVMQALGRLPESASDEPPGLEVAGTVVELGSDVTSLRAGDRVFGVALAGLAEEVVTPAALLAPLPSGLDPAAAAAMPIVFLTAWHALRRLGDLRPGQRVLIHAAAGGVGLAAIQLARKAGAEVFGTAGSEEKRKYLRGLGVPLVMDSRSLDFVEQVRTHTGGRGVDLVLDCLAGSAVDGGLSIVAPGGLFVELGKTDIRDPADVAARYPGIRYAAFDLVRMVLEDPLDVGRLWRRVVEDLAAGEVVPLPVTRFPMARAAEAFTHMARARHVGKIVLSVGEPAIQPVRAGAAPVRSMPATRPGDIAIVGMAGRFPGAPDLETFWANLRAGQRAFGSVPDGRWSAGELRAFGVTPLEEGRLRLGGFLEDAELFDAGHFGIAPREAQGMDPQQRLLLEECWNALADAGFPHQRGDRRVGVFVGASGGEYAQKCALAGVPADGFSLASHLPSTLAARISYQFDLKGPALVLDLGCASSVAALQAGVESLRRGECDLALVAAVAVMATPQIPVMAERAGILSSSGACRPFAADADGMLLGEAAVALVLERSDVALARGDGVMAILKEVGIAQAGTTNGLSAPSATAQASLQRTVLERGGIDPATIDYVEGHGVGTAAGDSAELRALEESLGSTSIRPIGSVKGNTGHTLAAAGLTALAKVVLQMAHGELAPVPGASAWNGEDGHPRVDIVRRSTPWPRKGDHPRRAAINTFAINGGNGFLVVEEPPAPVRSTYVDDPIERLFLVSARTEEGLYRRLEALESWIRLKKPSVCDLAATLVLGHERMPWRAAFVAATAEELERAMEACREARRSGAQHFVGEGKTPGTATAGVFARVTTDLVDRLGEAGGAEARRERLTALAELFVQGHPIPAALAQGGRRLHGLPGYPFERRRYWIAEGAEAVAAPASPVAIVPPESPRERRVRRMLVELLRLEPDNELSLDGLLERGLDSILAVELRHRLAQELGLDVPLATLVGARGGAEIAERLRNLGEAAPTAAPVVLEPDPRSRNEPFPLTDLQLGYWIGRAGRSAGQARGCQVYWEFEAAPGDWEPEKVERALNALIRQHDMLRMTVLPDGQQLCAREALPYRIDVHDWRGLDAAAAARELEGLRERLVAERFAPDRWPLFSVTVSLEGDVRRLHLSLDLLIVDVLSLFRLLRQWGELLADPAALPAPPALSFRDYVLYLRSLEGSPAWQEAERYWTAEARTLPPAPVLPEGRLADAEDDGSTRRYQVGLPAAVWSSLQERARAADVTPAAVLLTAFAEVLGHWAASRRFTLNLTVYDRRPVHPDIQKVVGDFTSTLLLGLDLAEPQTVAARVRAVAGRLTEGLEHSLFNGVRVLRLLPADAEGKRPSMPVVFTSMLGYGAALGATGGRLTRLGRLSHGATQTPHVSLDAQVIEDEEGGLSFTWDVVDGHYQSGLMGMMIEAYGSLLARLAADGKAWERSAGQLIAEAEQARRERRNATTAPIAPDLLHEPFVRQALADPSRPAIVTLERTVSYGELLAKAAGIARHLDDVRPNQLVAVAIEKGWLQIAAVLAVHLAGAAYLPIEPTLPQERIEQLLRRGEARIVLSTGGSDIAWPAGVRVIDVDGITPVALTGMARRRCGPEDLAYVIFTSGSTGEPKGVMIDHRGALNTVVDINERFGVGPDDRVLGLSALGFDLSVYDIFGPLAVGGALVLPRARSVADPEHQAECVSRCGVTVWNSVPMFLNLFLEGEPPPEVARHLRLVMLSGDWIPLTLPPRLWALAPEAKLVSLGGATEASIWSILYPFDRIEPEWTSVPYGYPMRNQTFFILDEALEPCPDGVAGELFIGGIGLAQGYWRDAEKTAASFIRHPRTGERLYRTGDLGRYGRDGIIEFLGRRDGQVKVGGYRIELGEVEAALARHPDVAEAVAIAIDEGGGKRRLVAFCRGRRGTEPLPAEIAQFLRTKLPAYMVPSRIELVEAFPLNRNGKVDRNALAAGILRDDRPIEITPPASAVVRRARPTVEAVADGLQRVLAELLGRPSIDPSASFFELGVDSLTAVAANRRFRTELELDCTVTDLFEHPTVAALALHLGGGRGDERQGAIGEAGAEPITPIVSIEVLRADRRALRRQFRATFG